MSKKKGFGLSQNLIKKEIIKKKTNERLISWSPWPPASFQKKYPAFPFVLTIIVIIILYWYFSLLK
tara:strand:- start:923 stop:1120 length:198 start_codon:yes stop_codon:yes gene_type:complete